MDTRVSHSAVELAQYGMLSCTGDEARAFDYFSRAVAADPLWIAFWADLAATVVVFAFSAAFRNSSFYDPYWSVAPIALVAFFLHVATPGVPALRQGVVAALVLAWGVRLTGNWARGWGGLGHEDWRYVDLRAKTGRIGYWFVSFFGLHSMPTLIVFLALLPLWPALATGARPLGWLDAIAAAV